MQKGIWEVAKRHWNTLAEQVATLVTDDVVEVARRSPPRPFIGGKTEGLGPASEEVRDTTHVRATLRARHRPRRELTASGQGHQFVHAQGSLRRPTCDTSDPCATTRSNNNSHNVLDRRISSTFKTKPCTVARTRHGTLIGVETTHYVLLSSRKSRKKKHRPMIDRSVKLE